MNHLHRNIGLLHASNGLPKRIMQRITGRKWYHQRFDGAPLFIGEIAEAEVRKEKRKPTGTEADVRVCFYNNGNADWYLDMADVHRGANAVIALAKKDPTISKKLLKRWASDETIFARFATEEFPSITLKKLTNGQLSALWVRFWKLALDRFTSSSIIDHFALGTDETIRTMLHDEIFRTRAGKSLTDKEFTEVFSVATAPVRLSFINEAEIELLKIATGRSHNTLKQYQQRHFWISNNYIRAAVLPVSYFERQVREWQRSGKDLVNELKKIEATPAMSRTRKRSLFKRFRLSPLLKTLITISENFSWWQDERKKATYLTTHIGTLMLKEIGRRTGYNPEFLKYCVSSEIAHILATHVPTMQILQQRRKSCVIITTRDGFWIESGKKAAAIRKAMLGNQTLQDVQDVRGLTACLGRAIGTVRIVQSVREIGKVKKGDVIVAVMTRPDYVPAMRKAAAIVTNEGGVTSHAAIVSRELGIPCIIGTKIATRVFKDGDVVEVDANTGIVKKI